MQPNTVDGNKPINSLTIVPLPEYSVSAEGLLSLPSGQTFRIKSLTIGGAEQKPKALSEEQRSAIKNLVSTAFHQLNFDQSKLLSINQIKITSQADNKGRIEIKQNNNQTGAQESPESFDLKEKIGECFQQVVKAFPAQSDLSKTSTSEPAKHKSGSASTDFANSEISKPTSPKTPGKPKLGGHRKARPENKNQLDPSRTEFESPALTKDSWKKLTVAELFPSNESFADKANLYLYFFGKNEDEVPKFVEIKKDFEMLDISSEGKETTLRSIADFANIGEEIEIKKDNIHEPLEVLLSKTKNRLLIGTSPGDCKLIALPEGHEFIQKKQEGLRPSTPFFTT